MKDRIQTVKKILTQKGYCSVSDLAAELAVSEVTIRRYLDELESQAIIKRTHGGAFVGEEMIDVDYRVRETIHWEEKEAIGKLGFSLIESGESIFIDTGSTAAYLALAIDDTKRLTVITDSIGVAETLENKSNVKTILLGGQVSSPMHCVIGSLAEEAVKSFHFSKAFIGAAGLSMKNGLTQGNIEEIPIKRSVIENSKETIVLLDSSKFHKEVLISFLSLQQIDVLITDNGILDADCAALEELGLRVMIAVPQAKKA
jgi:DeoR family transcriptional regulator of aga operon